MCKTKISLTDSNEQAIKDYKILAVDKAELDIAAPVLWDGIVGLLPASNKSHPSFVSELKKQGIIEREMFSVRYIDQEYGSEITFGGFDSAYVPSANNFTYTDVYDSKYWSVGVRRIKYGDVVIGGEAIRGIIDTGSAKIMLPPQDYNRWFEQVSKGKTCGDYGSYKGCYCLNRFDFKDIYIMFDLYEYKISPVSYVEHAKINGQIFCYFLVGELQNSTLPTAILGDAFIRNYYILHDMENQRIGLYGGYMVYFPPESNGYFKFFMISF